MTSGYVSLTRADIAANVAPMTETNRETCPRCKGTGNIPAYSHYYGGLCLLCRGKGTIRKRPAARPRKAVVPIAPAAAPSHPADCDCPFCPMGGWIDA